MMLVSNVIEDADRILSVVSRLLLRRSIPAIVTKEADLRDIGLTSIDMVSLILAVEEEFGLFVPECEMTPDNFKSVGTIQSLLATLQRPMVSSELLGSDQLGLQDQLST